MEAIRGWKAAPERLRGASVAIGNFDGVHRGHQAILHAAKEAAKPLNAPTGAVIFEPYPRQYFQPEKSFFRLTPLSKKLELLAGYGCDFAAIIPFGKDVADMPAATFVETVLVEGYRIRHACVGYNFFFGKGRGGRPETLRDLGSIYGFDVTIIEPKGDAAEIFSSTRVREMLAEGDVAAASDMLGRPWRFSGVVESGAGRGTGLGYPTANIRLDPGVVLKHGIYAVFVRLADRTLKGAAYIGTRPTFDAGAPLLETFLFDFDGDLYGQEISIDFIGFVREDAKFGSPEALTTQMAADCQRAAEQLEQYSYNATAQG